jgi:hypothetical protein
VPLSLLASVNEVIEWTPDVAFGPKRHRRVRFKVISRLVGRPCLTILLLQLTIVLTQCPPA